MVGLPFVAIALASAAIDGLSALVALLTINRRLPADGEGRPASRLGLGRVAVAVAVTSVAFVVKAAGLIAIGMDRFGLVHLIYVDLVALIPTLAVMLLVADRVRPTLTPSVRALAVVGLVPAAVGVHATFIEPYRLQVERATVPTRSGPGGRPLTVAVLSDFQMSRVGPYERSVVDRLLAERPDLILMPGDVFQGDDDAFEAERPALRDLLARLDAPAGVFLAPGDTDQAPGRVARLVEGTKIVPLVNEIARFEYAGRSVAIGGVELDYDSPAALRVCRTLDDGPEASLRILLAHRPDVAFGLDPRSRVDLVVAGHTHGGQVVVPGFGPPMTLSGVPRDVAAGGLHRIGGHPIYVSRGVGSERGQAPRLRFFCPPELSILTVGGPAPGSRP